jgi:hypothetical protein
MSLRMEMRKINSMLYKKQEGKEDGMRNLKRNLLKVKV